MERKQAQILKEHEQAIKELEPDNDVGRQHFEKMLEDEEYTPFQASIGDSQFDDYQRQNLCDLLSYTLDGKPGRKDRVIELMSGNARNYPTLRRKFNRVEMLEQSKKMTVKYQSDIIKHILKIQDFVWPSSYYDCIVGCWILGYLNDQDRLDAIAGIFRALKDDGHLVIFEAVTKKGETIEGRFHDIKGQQLVIRSRAFYDRFFSDNHFKVVKSQRFAPIGAANEDQVGYVLRKLYA